MATNVQTSKEDFIDTLIKLGGVVSFLTTVVSFVLQVGGWLDDPETLRVVSGVAFALYAGSTFWFAFKARHVTATWRWSSLAVLYVATMFYFTWVGTWLIVPATKPIIIDNMTGISVWNYAALPGSAITIRRVTDKETYAMQIDYMVAKDGWVGIHREISSGALAGTKAIAFSFKGNGAPNTLELKLFRKPDASGRSAIFGMLWDQATNTAGWKYVEVPYSQFVCWRDTGCLPGELIKPDDIWKIDIAISNKVNDTPGRGTVFIGPILAIP